MKYAIVTGGSRGIGRQICLDLSTDLNYHVLVNYKENHRAASETLDSIKAAGGTGELLQFDVSNREQVAEAISTWKEDNSDAVIEVIVNNAGITRDGLFMWMKAEDWEDVINTNLNGFFNLTHVLLQPMLMHRYGRIVNIVSLSGLSGPAGQTNYAAAKAGVIAATKSLAKEVGKRGITVNAVAPGFITTDMTAEMDQATLKKQIPLNRFGTPAEVSAVVSFLASEKASYISGEVININGGIYS